MVILAVCRLQPLTHETVGAVARAESPVSCMCVYVDAAREEVQMMDTDAAFACFSCCLPAEG